MFMLCIYVHFYVWEFQKLVELGSGKTPSKGDSTQLTATDLGVIAVTGAAGEVGEVEREKCLWQNELLRLGQSRA